MPKCLVELAPKTQEIIKLIRSGKEAMMNINIALGAKKRILTTGIQCNMRPKRSVKREEL